MRYALCVMRYALSVMRYALCVKRPTSNLKPQTSQICEIRVIRVQNNPASAYHAQRSNSQLTPIVHRKS